MLLLGDDPLTVFLNTHMGRPFQWGDWDCLQFLAHWIEVARGVRPGADHHYHDLKGAVRVVRSAGGMVEHVDRCVRPLGMAMTEKPMRGDIAIVQHPSDPDGGRSAFDGQLGAIVVGAGLSVWCLPVAGGLCLASVTALPIVKSWRL